MNSLRYRSLVSLVCAAAMLSGFPGPALAAFYPGNLSAYFRGTLPAQPLAGQPFVLDVVSAPCEFLIDAPNAATVESFDGEVLTVRIPGVPSIACNFPFEPRHYDLPGLPAGTYRIDLVFYRIEQPGDQGEIAGYIGGRDVTVAQAGLASISAIPTVAHSTLLATLLAIVLIGIRRLTP